VAKAIDLARQSGRLRAIREALQRQRDTSALRDMPGTARRLEQLFWQMQGESERGETPTPDLRNLDLYYEIGAEIVLENVEFQDDRTYRHRYIEKLIQRHDYTPVSPDGRLWAELPLQIRN